MSNILKDSPTGLNTMLRRTFDTSQVSLHNFRTGRTLTHVYILIPLDHIFIDEQVSLFISLSAIRLCLSC